MLTVKVKDLRDRVIIGAWAWSGSGQRILICSRRDSIGNVHGLPPERVGWMR